MEVNGSIGAMDVDTSSDASVAKEGAPKDGTTAPPMGSNDADKSEASSAQVSSSFTSDSEDEPRREGDAVKASSSKSPEDKLVKAVSYKDRGNACIASDSAAALKHYERGIKIVSSLSTDEQAKALLVSLRLNLSLACTKEERYFDAASAATKVLGVEPANLKALFRRGVARARLGSLDDARSDLLAVIKADPRNSGAKKELKVVRDRLSEHREKEKASFGGLFEKGPMYNDKEVERQKREAEAAKRLKEEEAEWRSVNERRKADGKEKQTLEDWRKEKKAAEEKAQKEREKEKPKSKPPRPANAAPPPKTSSKRNAENTEGEDMELDEEDLKIIHDTKKQGYCYFKRTLSEKEQSLLDAEQIKLRARVSSPPPVQVKNVDTTLPAEGTRSVWNEAGTWEEVDKTEWCKAKLTEALSKVTVTEGKDPASDPEFLLEKLGSFDFTSVGGDGAGGKGLEALSELRRTLAKLCASITNVEISGGDAHVICVSNKIKHIFEFNVNLKFALTIDESMGLPPRAEGEHASRKTSPVETYKGKLEFPDMTNNDVDHGRFDSEPELKWDKGSRWESTYDDRVKSCLNELKASIMTALGYFFEEFKSS